MRAFPLAAAVTLVVARAVCASAPSDLSDADKAATRSGSQKYVGTANAQNVDGWLQQVSDNAVFMPLNHAPVEGRKAIGDWLNATIKSLHSTERRGGVLLRPMRRRAVSRTLLAVV